MSEHTPGRAFVQPTAITRHGRLVPLLADMVPDARTIRVARYASDRRWPNPYARAYDDQGRLLTLDRARRVAAARWVIRASPELNRNEPHDLDLASGDLRPTVDGYTDVARGR